MEKPITHVGLDVHKDTIAIALTEAGKRGEVREQRTRIGCISRRSAPESPTTRRPQSSRAPLLGSASILQLTPLPTR